MYEYFRYWMKRFPALNLWYLFTICTVLTRLTPNSWYRDEYRHYLITDNKLLRIFFVFNFLFHSWFNNCIVSHIRKNKFKLSIIYTTNFHFWVSSKVYGIETLNHLLNCINKSTMQCDTASLSLVPDSYVRFILSVVAFHMYCSTFSQWRVPEKTTVTVTI